MPAIRFSLSLAAAPKFRRCSLSRSNGWKMRSASSGLTTGPVLATVNWLRPVTLLEVCGLLLKVGGALGKDAFVDIGPCLRRAGAWAGGLAAAVIIGALATLLPAIRAA